MLNVYKHSCGYKWGASSIIIRCQRGHDKQGRALVHRGRDVLAEGHVGSRHRSACPPREAAVRQHRRNVAPVGCGPKFALLSVLPTRRRKRVRSNAQPPRNSLLSWCCRLGWLQVGRCKRRTPRRPVKVVHQSLWKQRRKRRQSAVDETGTTVSSIEPIKVSINVQEPVVLERASG